MSAPREIEPDTAPGGLVFKVYVGNREVAHGEVPARDVLAGLSVEVMALRHADAANRAKAATGETTSWLYVYDGDSGVCVGTLIVD